MIPAQAARDNAGGLVAVGAWRGLPGRALAFLALALALALTLSSLANAETRHIGVTSEFGPDGTAGTTFTELGQIDYQQSNNRIVVLTGASIHAFNNPAPNTYSPVGAPFPFPQSGPVHGDSDIAVDNTGGASAGNIYVAHSSSVLDGYSPSGSLLGGWPVNVGGGEVCGISVDHLGRVGGGFYTQLSVPIYSAAGTLQQSVNVAVGGSPCKITFDQQNGDLYVAPYGGGPIYQFTAASNYTASKPFAVPGGNNRLVVNSVKDVLYTAIGNQVRAYDIPTGQEIEAFAVPISVTGLAVDEDTDTLFLSGGGAKVAALVPAEVPKVTTEEAAANATVAGTVDPDGAGEVTDCYFEWGPTTSYGNTEPCAPAPPYNAPQAVTAELPGLEGEVTYNYRLVATNANGTNYGLNGTITPHNVQGLKTGGVTNLTRVSATLNGSFEGNGEATTYYFEWGTTTAYGEQSPVESAGSPVDLTQLDFDVTGLQAGTTYHYRVVGENGLGISKADDRTFTTPEPVANVSTEAATDLTPTTATLNGSFDIDPLGGATEYYFELGATPDYGSKTPVVDAGSTPGHPLVSEVTGVEENKNYHFRIVVTNELGTTYGANQEFKTPARPAIEGLTSQNVTATTADLKAQINPNGEPTTYRFEYGLSQQGTTPVPVPDGVVGSGTSPIEVLDHIADLQVGGTYYFRVVATNKWGSDVSEFQTFAFFTPNCPNAHVRQQGGAAYLPDCRAYELVSPGFAGAVQLFPGLGLGPIVQEYIPMPPSPNPGLASSPSRFAFWGGIGQVVGTNPPNITQDLYLATRTSSGWETHYPGLTASQSFASGTTSCNAEMSRCINYDIADPLEFAEHDTGSNAPYVFDATRNSESVGRFPTMVGDVPDGETFTGEGLASSDYSHFAFSSNDIQFSAGGLTAAPGSAYDNDTAANTATLISKTPGGSDIAQDPAGCTADETKQRQCAEEFLRIQAVSEDGSRVLLSNWAPPRSGTFPTKQKVVDAFKPRDVHLTMRAGGVSYDVPRGHRADFTGMTPDGSRVFFTSDEALTGEDTDTSIDLYMWEADGDQLSLISDGSGGSGDSDECSTSWNGGKCNVQMPNFTIDTLSEVPGELFTPDNWVTRSGDVYFYSPEQLDGTGKGGVGERNLYVYRNGAARFVAELEKTRPVRRMQVTPDGQRIALVTATQLTSYVNAGIEEMYTVDVDTGKTICVSCVPTGAPPSANVEAAGNGLFMSDDGRTFYSSKDPLVPYDTNGLYDVYEYVDGRPQLISSGTASRDTWGGGLLIYPAMTVGLEGVSADGVDVYFSTFDSLVPTDRNGEFIKIYNARSAGGFLYQAPRPACKAADECHAGASQPPAPPQVGTSAQLGNTGDVKKAKSNAKKKNAKKKKANKKKNAKKRRQAKRAAKKAKAKNAKRNKRSNRGKRGGRRG